MEEGYIYCISNLEIMPDIYKVGMTMRSPLDRLKEANSSDTWKIPTFKLDFAKKVVNPKDKERKLHKHMEKFMTRVHPRREFFKGKIEDIKEVFDLLDGEMWDDTPPITKTNDYEVRNIDVNDRLSDDEDIRVRQIKELILDIFSDHKVEIRERSANKDSHFLINIDDMRFLVIENHNKGRGKVAMLTTPYSINKSDKKNPLLTEYFRKLNWEPYGIGASRKQYDTQGKTKSEVKMELEKLKQFYIDNISENVTNDNITDDNIIDDNKTDNKDNSWTSWLLSKAGGSQDVKYKSTSMDIQQIIWSDEKKTLTDKFNNTYGFLDNWNGNPYIKTISKNDSLFRINGGIHRGYCIWLDSQDIIHISHGHKNIQSISHCIFDDNTITDGWLCTWGGDLNIRFSKEDIRYIHDHFNLNSL
jgi:hypothetical protein